MDYIVFSDGYRLKIEDGGELGRMVHVAPSDAQAAAISEKIAGEKLDLVTILNGDNVIAEYRDLMLNGPVMRYTEDGKVYVVLSFREKTSIEARLDALEESQNVQDGAIEELGTVVSDLSEV